MKVAIAGSGTLGCGFGYLLQKNGNAVTLMDYWEDHIQSIRENGLTISINGEVDNAKMTIGKPEEIEDKFDVIFVFTKSMGLRSMMEAIKHTIKEDTQIVCLLNGLGHAQTLSEYVSQKNIIMGTTVWTAGIDAPGVTHFMGQGPVELQNADPSQEEAARKVEALLSEAGLNGVYSEDVHFTIWRKACVNGTMNALCALLDGTIKEVFESSQIDFLLNHIVSEFAQLARTEGVELDVEETIAYLKALALKVGSHYPSMHQDLANRRLTEIDFLNGTVARESEAKGLEAPYCQMITQLIHAKEDVLGISK
ncbi:2-dehydropantoate 2-reductase [Jeotgalibaca porci]|uniref:2-dehydropantoate 2-reductase n=1 Tax=Jeotgalibaca porci TaxID=1868793 RepID=UPI00359FC237